MNSAIHRLSLRQVTKSYGNVPVLDIPELDVVDGEFFTLLGPSGSGKTTTLKLVAGFELPTNGSIRLQDRDVASVPVDKRNIGVVFQNYALFPHMTVAQNIAFPLQMRKISKKETEQRVAEMLEVVDLVEHGHKNASLLSGGQQQRVAIARALVFNPELLLMDEPLGALDRKLRLRLQEELRSLQKRLGITVIYVTHDQDEAMTMSDRVAIMNNGAIEQIAAPRELYDRPDTLFVSNFLGDNNSLTGVVKDAETIISAEGLPLNVGNHGLAAGTPVDITIRPERFLLQAPDAGASRKRNAITRDCTIIDMIPMGATTKYVVDVAGLGRIRTHIQHWGEHFEGEVGGRAQLSWSADDFHVFSAK